MRWSVTSGLLVQVVCLTRLASFGRSGKIDKTCEALEGNQIDWDCVFGPGSLSEVHERGGKFTTCSNKKESRHPCSRFIVPKEGERSEVKVKGGPEGFPFKKNEKYIYKYSFRPKDGMQVGKQYTHFGQLKGDESYDGTKIIFGVPIFSLTANLDGLMVRFSNLDSIENYHAGFEKALSWKESSGKWVHVKITTVLGKSMKVELSGAVEGTAVWPEHLKPIAWHKDAKMARLKLGLYHKTGKVADGEVEYRNIQIEGPNGIIRTSPRAEPSGSLYRGCVEDELKDRVLDDKKYVDAHMTNELCEELCEGYEYFGTQFGSECFCGDSKSRLFKHGKSNKCSKDCGGKSRIKKCGGWLALSVFQYEGSPTDIPSDTDYVGCFKDKEKDRVFTLKSSSSKKMTYKKCKKICNEVDAKYFGVQYSEECFCGSSKADYDQHGKGICGMSCAGDPDEICGGFGTMNVFRIT